MDWITANWEFILLGVYIAEKIVKVTPWPYDDIILDMIIKPIVHMGMKKKEDAE